MVLFTTLRGEKGRRSHFVGIKTQKTEQPQTCVLGLPVKCPLSDNELVSRKGREGHRMPARERREHLSPPISLHKAWLEKLLLPTDPAPPLAARGMGWSPASQAQGSPPSSLGTRLAAWLLDPPSPRVLNC